MENEKQENEVIIAIKEEYEKKIQELEENHKKEIEEIEKKANERVVSQIRAFMSGKGTEQATEQEPPKEKTWYEEMLEETRLAIKR